MKRVLILLIAAITVILGNELTQAKKTFPGMLTGGFSASTLIERQGGYTNISSRCQRNLKKAGFTLSNQRTVTLHDVDDEYNDVLVKATEKTYSKGRIKVYLNYIPGTNTPCSLEIDFPNQTSRNSFLKSLRVLGFIGSGDSYVATSTGLCVSCEGNHVEIAYTL